ncbi:MAG: serine/threonine-protein kinase PknK [Deltaproteobacteria bacterium]|nr:MAG: serine/threonine-protein kinase PknK [Deltaproteobacteria bacterium]
MQEPDDVPGDAGHGAADRLRDQGRRPRRSLPPRGRDGAGPRVAAERRARAVLHDAVVPRGQRGAPGQGVRRHLVRSRGVVLLGALPAGLRDRLPRRVRCVRDLRRRHLRWPDDAQALRRDAVRDLADAARRDRARPRGVRALRRDPPELPGGLPVTALAQGPWRPIGAGGFGSVYAARSGGVEVAVKIAHRVDDARFARERDALGRLPAGTAPRLLGHARTADGRPMLVLELLHGETLAGWLARAPRPPLAARLARFEAACAAVAAIHAAGVIHRDLTPANLFVCRDGSLRVLDFGLARPRRDARPAAPPLAITRTGQRLGTAAYMAPEQCRGEAVDERADIYALGAILFEVLCGRPPFVGDAASVMQAHAARRPWPPSAIAGDEVIRLDDVVLRCLAKDPAQRFAGAGELAAAIRSAVAVAAPCAADAIDRRRVALLCVASDATRAELAAAVAPCGGAVARIHGEHCVISFAGAASPRRGIIDALRAAARLGARVRAARIHVDEVALRLRASGPIVLGAALDRPDGWPPASIACDGVALTEAAAALIDVRPAPPAPGEPALRGRGALVVRLEAAAHRALTDRRPAIAWITGAVGTGKTRIAQALGGRVAARVLVLTARDPATGGDATRAVLRSVLDLPAAATARDVAGACRRLALDGPLAAGLGYALGVVPASSQAVRELLEAPGAVRVAIARAVAEALRRRAAAPLVVIADDAHWLDPAILDGIARAAEPEHGCALWVLATAGPNARAPEAAAVHELGALDDADARALLLDLLAPAEFVPEAIVAPLLAAGRGIPLYLTETVAALRSAGALRASSAGAWYVAGEGLAQLGASPLFEQLAERHLAALPGDVAAFARMCAILGDGLAIAAIDAIQRVLERDGDRGGGAAARAIAPAVGIDHLVRTGLITLDAGVRFRHPLLREAIELRLRRQRARGLGVPRARRRGAPRSPLRARRAALHRRARARARGRSCAAWRGARRPRQGPLPDPAHGRGARRPRRRPRDRRRRRLRRHVRGAAARCRDRPRLVVAPRRGPRARGAGVRPRRAHRRSPAARPRQPGARPRRVPRRALARGARPPRRGERGRAR